MSLDVYLQLPAKLSTKPEHIIIREDGQNREISRTEWDRRFPGKEPVALASTDVFWANMTHNLGKMAEEAGLYQAMWRPEELGITTAAQLIEPLARGLALLLTDPVRFAPYNPSNGWGSYVGLVRFVGQYLDACREWPEALVVVSR